MKPASRLFYDETLDILISCPKEFISRGILLLKNIYSNNIEFLVSIIRDSNKDNIKIVVIKHNRTITFSITKQNYLCEYLLQDNDTLLTPMDFSEEVGIIEYNIENKISSLISWLLKGTEDKDKYNYSYKYNRMEKENLIYVAG